VAFRIDELALKSNTLVAFRKSGMALMLKIHLQSTKFILNIQAKKTYLVTLPCLTRRGDGNKKSPQRRLITEIKKRQWGFAS